MWHSFSLTEIQDIHRWICAETRKGEASGLLAEFKSTSSYWKGNFCSAAVRAYGEYMAVEQFENGILESVKPETTGKDVAKKAEGLIRETAKSNLERYLAIGVKGGEEKVAAVKVRVNQNIFRKLVLENYGGKCCITGLDIPAVLQASHISSWEADKVNRLNPENGLCLSATYHEAFDAHLISFDEQCRLVVSRRVKDYYDSASAREYFAAREGQKMLLPVRFLPSQTFLEKHRELLIA